MRALSGFVVFIFLAAFMAGVTLAQSSRPGGSDRNDKLDQPVEKTRPAGEDPEAPPEDPIPDPPPFFGEDGNAGEKMKIVWCLDRSGSMATSAGSYTGADGQPTTGTRWDRAKSETTIALSQLTPEWQFGIVTYACNRDKFNPDLVDAEPGSVAAAIAWLSGHFPWGGTGTGPAPFHVRAPYAPRSGLDESVNTGTIHRVPPCVAAAHLSETVLQKAVARSTPLGRAPAFDSALHLRRLCHSVWGSTGLATSAVPALLKSVPRGTG